MPQMVIIQAAAPQARPQAPASGSPGKKEQNQFSPHLENALSSKKHQQQVAHEKSRKSESSSTDKNTLNSENNQSVESEEATDSFAPSTGQNVEDDLNETPSETLLSPLNAEKTRPIAENTSCTFSQPKQVRSAANLLLNKLVGIASEPNKSGKTPAVNREQPELSSTINEPVVQDSIRPALSSGQDALISQLQRIIDKVSEAGTGASSGNSEPLIVSKSTGNAGLNLNGSLMADVISITKVTNTSLPHSINSNIHGVTTASSSGNSEPLIVTTGAETSAHNLNGLLMADINGAEKAAGKPTHQISGNRHDSQQQYLNAKMFTQNLAENSQNFQGNNQGDELAQQNSGSSPLSGPFSAAEQTNTFSQISTTVQETTTQPANELAKSITLPSGTIVHEDEIIQQLSQRFQLSNRNMDSRINLKLHPVELGELKIDLSIKEGSIRANVVAQSQHTLEILEKNISKLKTVLENQGFTVDEISVTVESDSVSDFDLFDRQLFGHNNYTPKTPKGRREAEAAFTLDENIYAAAATSTGVNVKI